MEFSERPLGLTIATLCILLTALVACAVGFLMEWLIVDPAGPALLGHIVFFVVFVACAVPLSFFIFDLAKAIRTRIDERGLY